MFSWLHSWRERRGVLQELHRMTRDESAVLSLDDANPLQRSKMPLESGDRDGARHYLALARERLPGYVVTSPDTITVLLGLGDLDELEQFTREGTERFPRRAQYWEGFAVAAERRRDFAEAAKRWAIVRRKFPYPAQGYANGAACLRELGHYDEALKVVRRGLSNIREDVPIALEGGRTLEAQQDWSGLLRHWQASREEHGIGCAGYAYALFRLGRRDEAEAELERGRDRYRTDIGIEIMASRIAREAGDMEGAARRLEVMRKRFPYDFGALMYSLHFLRDQKAWTDADAVATTAIERFPKEDWPLSEYAHLAEARGDWAVAAERWHALREAFPLYRPAWERGATALVAAGRQAEADQLRAQERERFSSPQPPG